MTPKSIDYWNNGERKRVVLAERKGNAPLMLYVRGHWLIDDLEIRGISPEEVPDVSAVLEKLGIGKQPLPVKPKNITPQQ